MRRKLRDFISLAALKHLLYLPHIFLTIKNWFPFLLNYMGFKNDAQIYQLAKNLQIKTNEGVDSATIMVVFIKNAYGNLSNKTTIIDIGANIGVFSIYATSQVKNVIIYAYEPMPKNFNLLLENIKLNKLENKIQPFKKGVGAKSETRRLFLSGGSPYHSLYANTGNYIDVNIVSLKDIFDENHIEFCDLLKSDCEGAEFEIFYNTPKTYLEKINEIRLEYHDQIEIKWNIESLIDFFKINGFSLTYYKKDSIKCGNVWFKNMKV